MTIKFKKKANQLFLLSIFLFIQVTASAQLAQSSYYEMPIARGYDFELLPLKNELILYRILKNEQGLILNAVSLDTALHERWKSELKIPLGPNYILETRTSYKENLYFIFKSTGNSSFKIVTIRNFKECKIYLVNNTLPFKPFQFDITTEAALLGGYYNNIPMILYVNLHKEEQKTLSGYFHPKDKLAQFCVYNNGSFDVLVAGKNQAHLPALLVNHYNADGNLIDILDIPSEAYRTLTFTHLIKSDDTLQLIAGHFGKPRSVYSNGVFITTLGENKQHLLTYHTYNSMTTSFKNTDKPLNIKLNIHGLLVDANQYYIVGEAGYPKYIKKSYNYLGKAFRYNDMRRYRYMLVACFNKYGNLIWENSFRCAPNRSIAAYASKNQVAFLYAWKNTIKPVILDGQQIKEGEVLNLVKPGNSNNEITDRRSVKLMYWYDNFFVAYKTLPGNSDGKVLLNTLFISKILVNKM